MAGKSDQRTSRRISPVRLTVIGVIAFLVLDAVLIGIALSRSGASSDPGVPRPIPTFIDENAPTSTPTPTPTPTGTAAPASSPVTPAPRLLAASSATEAWRTTPGACPATAAVIEQTVDGGLSWAAVEADSFESDSFESGDVAASRVLALSASPGSAVIAASMAPDCEIDAATTTGEGWESDPEALANLSWVDPGDSALIQTAAGPIGTPCPTVFQVQPTPDRVAALCAGAVFERDAAGTWVTLPLAGVTAMTSGPAGYTVASTGSPGCAGIAISSVASPLGSSSPTPIGCLADESAASGVTLASAGSSLWLWSGDRVWVSPDGGATW